MQSSPGSLSPQAQSAVSLAILALAALGLSLLLAIAALPKPRIVTPATTTSRPSAMPHSKASPIRRPANNPARVAAAPKTLARTPALEPLLVPWAIGVDALALLGLGVVWFVRRRVQT